jgi:hypothetical protein
MQPHEPVFLNFSPFVWFPSVFVSPVFFREGRACFIIHEEDGFVRLHFFRIKGEHVLHANWPLQTANGLQCHKAHANWFSQTAIITDRAVYNAIQPVRRCASAIAKKHATQNPLALCMVPLRIC